jgi:solute:Na+ symporter, SSS family
MNLAATIILIIVGVSVGIGFASSRRVRKGDLASWSVGGRSYGVVLFWVLAAGETYSTATFLGTSGGVYSQGYAAMWTLAYGTLAMLLGYLYLPKLWAYAKRHNLVTQADFFAHRFGSRWIGGLFGVVGVAFMLPYIEVQLLGFGQIIDVTSGGALPAKAGMLVAFAVVAVFVLVAGMHSTAWVAVIKDALMIIAIAIVGIYLPLHYFHGFGNAVDHATAAHPELFSLKGAAPYSSLWMISTLIISSLAYFMFPHSTAAIFSAKSEKTVRRNTIYLPFYNLLLFLPMFVGLTALLVTPGLKGSATNAVLLDLSVKSLPSWVVGIVGGAGALAAIVPVSLLVLQSATQLSKNVYKGTIHTGASEVTVLRVSKVLVLVVMAIALALAAQAPDLLVNLLQIGQQGVSQLFPAVVLGLFWKRLARIPMLVGAVVGVGMVAWSVISSTSIVAGMNIGLIAFAVNVVITVGGSLVVPVPDERLLPEMETAL